MYKVMLQKPNIATLRGCREKWLKGKTSWWECTWSWAVKEVMFREQKPRRKNTLQRPGTELAGPVREGGLDGQP